MKKLFEEYWNMANICSRKDFIVGTVIVLEDSVRNCGRMSIFAGCIYFDVTLVQTLVQTKL